MDSRLKSKKIKALYHEMQRLPEGSLIVKNAGNYSAFVHYIGHGVEKNINRNMNLVYQLARKKYLSLYIPTLEGEPRVKLDLLLARYAKAGLEIDRITLTKEQYKWVHEPYKTNPYKPELKKYASTCNVLTRSKSEREIMNQYERFGVPTRYENAKKVDLSSLIPALEKQTADFRAGRSLFHFSVGVCYWNVPPELSWMNMPGSIWRGMDPRTYTTTIYPDFSSLTYNNKIVYHEHEGVASDPYYRCTSSDRIFVLRETGAIPEDRFIMTFERDLKESNKIIEIIETKILPWI